MLRLRKQAVIKKEIIKVRLFLFILMYLIFLTAYFSLNTFSKYVGVVDGGGEVQVAKWEVSSTSESNSMMNIVAGNTENTYEIKVTSTSDVGCTYSIVLSNIPSGLKIKLNDGSFEEITSGTKAYSNIGHFDAGSSGIINTYTLTMKADLPVTEVANQVVDIDVVFVQDTIQ